MNDPRPSRLFILKDRKPVAVDSRLAWCRWMDENDCHVGDVTIGPLRVSTVFLGINHAMSRSQEPILFETMIFGVLGRPMLQTRCATWEEAESMHNHAVRVAELTNKSTDAIDGKGRTP